MIQLTILIKEENGRMNISGRETSKDATDFEKQVHSELDAFISGYFAYQMENNNGVLLEASGEGNSIAEYINANIID